MEKFLTANFHFSDQEYELKSRVMALNVLLLVVATILSIMTVVRFSGNNPQQGMVDLVFAALSIFGLFWIRGNKNRIASVVRAASLSGLLITSALFIYVPEDTLRLGWFLVLLVFTFFLCGQKIGFLISALSIIIVCTTHILTHTGYSNYDIFYFCNLAVLVTIFLSFYEYRNTKNRLRLQSLNTELEDKVQTRTAELAKANKELELFFYALDTSLDWVIVSDMQGRINYTNNGALNSSGYASHEVLGQPVSIFCTDKNYVTREIFPSLQTHGHWKNEFQAKRKNGSAFPAFISSTIILDKSEAPLGILYIIRDMTEIKQAEEKKLQLERKIQQSSKMKAIGLMASGVAHDLNNILSGMINYPELLLLELPEDSPLRHRIEKIQNSGLRAAAVVADLLTVARGVAAAKKTCDLNRLLQEYLVSPEIKRSLETQTGIELRTDLSANPSTINCSAIHVRKCLLNLVINGCEAIYDTGTVTVSTRKISLETPLKGTIEIPKGEYVVLSVQDSGTGISRVDIVHIFEPFYSKKVLGRSGTGIGLAVVWNVVRDHDGYIDVTSDSSGTCFDIYFPMSHKPADDEKGEIAYQNLQGQGQTVLIVDDEAIQRDISTSLLTSLGYNAASVSSGEEAVSYLNTHKVDLLVLDMIMEPGMNGRKTYEQIIFLHPGQKAVITSGFSETDEVKKAQALGAGLFIIKPYTLDQLGKAVKQELMSP